MGEKARLYVDIIAQHDSVTGSCFLLVVKSPNGKQAFKGIVDCGMFQERETEERNQNFAFNANELSFAIVTHAHLDHMGRIPKLSKEGYSGYIFCSEDTKNILPWALKNAHSVMKKRAKLRHKPEMELYEDDDIEDALSRTRALELYKFVQIHEQVRVMLIPNEHIVGAVMIWMQIYGYNGKEVINLLFTGDYHHKNMFLSHSLLPLELVNAPITVISEATYGTSNSKKQEIVFCENVKKAISQKKQVLVPAFALGRSQEVLYLLRKMQERGEIPNDVPIYFDGNLAQTYTKMFCDGSVNVTVKDFLPENLRWVQNDVERQGLINGKKSHIVVTTSGMGQYGPAQMYIPGYVEKPNAVIHFTGYCANGTWGRTLSEAKQNESFVLGGMVLEKKAEMLYTTEMSSHAKGDELIDLLKQFNKLQSVIVNHGEQSVKLDFAKRIIDNQLAKKVGIIDSLNVFRVGEYGIIKTISLPDNSK